MGTKAFGTTMKYDPGTQDVVGHFIVSLIAICIVVANISLSGLWYPDAPSHALNGVFYKDMTEEGGLLHPISYAERYYVQYPNLTVGTYPPVFYAVEALFFKLFGVSSQVARFPILLFTLLGANAFLVLCRLWFPLWLSVAGAILYLLQPATLFGQKNVMLEMPALAMSTIALYFFYVASEKGGPWIRFLSPLFAALAFLTKQNTIFLLAIWVLWIVWDRKWNLVKSKHFIVGVLVGSLLLLPWVIINLTISRYYVVAAIFQGYHIESNFVYYLTNLSEIISYPVIVLSMVSLILFSKLIKYGSYRFALLWGCCVFCGLLLFEWTEPRQAIYLVPAVIILCIHAIWFFGQRIMSLSQRSRVYAVVLILLISLHVNAKEVIGGPDIRGFDKVADFVVSDPDCVSVLYDGYFNSNFAFHMRSEDKERHIFVFRASKLVFSTKWLLELGYYDLIKDFPTFHDTLNRYSVKYIVQEQRDSIRTPGNRRLRQWVQRPEFKLVQEYPVHFQGLDPFGNLLVYEYLNYEKKAVEQVDLDMPTLGRRISVRVKEKT
jgi:hypothetical protein